MGFMLNPSSRAQTRDRESVAILNVEVMYDHEAEVWVADCEPLGIVTEAQSYEAVTQQVRDLVPDMARENNMDFGNQKIHLVFQHIDENAVI